MPLVVAGLDHRSSPNHLLRYATIPAEALHGALDRISKSDHVNEAVIVSTCQRTEIYLDAVRFHGAVSDVRHFFGEITGAHLDELIPYLVERHDRSVCTHLFSLAAGIESVMVGEGEILGQLARSWQVAQGRGTSRSVLNGLFRHALVTGKRARNETRIGAGITSIGTATVSLVEQHIALSGKTVLVVGAGDVATKVALAARRAGAQEISIANRTRRHAEVLAERVGGVVADLAVAVGRSDVVISATGANEPVVGVAHFSTRSVIVVDLGMPPDVEQGVGELENVELFCLDDVEEFVNRNRSDRLDELAGVRSIVDEEVHAYFADANERVVGPLVSALYGYGEQIRGAELARFDKRLALLDDEQKQAVDELTRAMLSKVFHAPVVGLKSSAGTPEGERDAESMRKLFSL